MQIKIFNIKELPFLSVALFVIAWLCIGNFWSIFLTYWHVNISLWVSILFAIIYLLVTIPVIIFFFVELFRLKSKIKWVIAVEIIIFFAFVIAPPRNADAMRVWLAKVYDVWMHGEKIVRPYFHYNTPDAFTLFHLPLINFLDGQIFQLSIWISLCAIIILFIKIARIYIISDTAIAICICLFLFNPLIILASTVILSDMPIILAVTGLIYAMILYQKGEFNKTLFFIMLFIAFGMNIKYNMLMFLPVIIFWMVVKIWKDGVHWESLPIVLFLVLLSIYPYFMNYLNIGNPVYPALTKIFPAKEPYWDVVALNNTEPFLAGERNIQNFIKSFINLFFIPYHINPLTVLTIFFIFTKFKYLNFIPSITVITYFFILFLMMPHFVGAEKERYVLYVFPITIIFGIINIYSIKAIKKIFESAVIITILIYLVFTFVYSKDVFNYILTGDKEKWHEYTWYYHDYEWINKNISLKPSENILVIASAQQTYYLRKPYLNADSLSAFIDWRKNIDEIVDIFNKYNIKYIFVDENFVKSMPSINKSIQILEDRNIIFRIRENKVKLSYSRLKNIFEIHTTVLYEINKYR